MIEDLVPSIKQIYTANGAAPFGMPTHSSPAQWCLLAHKDHLHQQVKYLVYFLHIQTHVISSIPPHNGVSPLHLLCNNLISGSTPTTLALCLARHPPISQQLDNVSDAQWMNMAGQAMCAEILVQRIMRLRN